MKYYVGVGINKSSSDIPPLRGCVNDIYDILTFLTSHKGLDKGVNTRVIIDNRATLSAIRTRLDWLCGVAKPGDVCIFNQSSHGTQVPERWTGTETDGMDEVLVPYDFTWDGNYLRDDELGEYARKIAERGAVPVFILDACHSGTALKEFLARPSPEVEEEYTIPLWNKDWCTLRRTLKMPVDIEARIYKGIKSRTMNSEIEDHAILISGCKDNETSADAFFNGRFNGAMTVALLNTLSKYPQLTYDSLAVYLTAWLRAEGFSQTPQVSGGPELMKRIVLD